MLKGKTKIELFNAETGQREASFEETNLVTNAVRDLLAFMNRIDRAPSNNVFPIATNALGGIMLFDHELEEDPDKYAFPSEARLVGYSNRGVNTSDPKRGSLNSLETGRIDNGYVSVWDFGTSQANGEIAAVCLTSAYAGANPYMNFINNDFHADLDYYGDHANKYNYHPVMIRDGYMYSIRGSQIYKMPYHPQKIDSVHDSTGFGGMLPESVCDISSIKFRNMTACVDGDDGYLYFIHFHHEDYDVYHGYPQYYTNYYYENAHNNVTTLSVYTVHYGDDSWEVSGERVIELPNANLANLNNWGCMAASQGYLFWRGYDNTCIYIINLHNFADVKRIPVGDEGETQIRIGDTLRPWLAGDGIAFSYVYRVGTTDYTRVGFMFSDGSISVSKATGNFTCNNNNMSFCDGITMIVPNCAYYYSSDIGYGYVEGIYLMAAYLGTINNLSSHITKNASQTMKITYTLTDEPEKANTEEG